ncbi:hypothetical protein F2Q69_00013370 [Brassica cretica]|uniref:Uncharacterized protein n=1 Tax=Brassica cretica TaxID=69181 RepID=A0A8S9R388_BRACR|nr:hypothetical protein F2Q69_00013370 [Brassica cretica]
MPPIKHGTTNFPGSLFFFSVILYLIFFLAWWNILLMSSSVFFSLLGLSEEHSQPVGKMLRDLFLLIPQGPHISLTDGTDLELEKEEEAATNSDMCFLIHENKEKWIRLQTTNLKKIRLGLRWTTAAIDGSSSDEDTQLARASLAFSDARKENGGSPIYKKRKRDLGLP